MCLPNYFGMPPNCRPECVINSDCMSSKSCINGKCRDPCPNSCGVNAICHVNNHIPICTCLENYVGDPFISCHLRPVIRKINLHIKLFSILLPQYFILFNIPEDKPIPQDPCNPFPCGSNAHCSNGICTCISEYHGDPYTGCRPECILNSDCARNKACIRNKCTDPCPGTCGSQAICNVVNHVPICSCPHDMTGNPFISCRILPRMYLFSIIF